MTIHRSGAAISGIMPDYSQAGVIMCRTGVFTTVNDDMVSGDTIQMVPVPKGAIIMNIQAYAGTAISGCSQIDIGDGSSSARFFNGFSWGDLNYLFMDNTDGVVANIGYCYDEGNDTIDINLSEDVSTKVPTSIKFTMHVWYKMTGSISDENWTGPVTS